MLIWKLSDIDINPKFMWLNFLTVESLLFCYNIFHFKTIIFSVFFYLILNVVGNEIAFV